MKTLFKIVMTATLLLAGVSVRAQSLSNKYSDKQVEELILKYKTSPTMDVIPSESLLKKFKKDFPNSYDIEWEKSADLYNVEFEISRKDHKAYYDEKGNLLMYMVEIKSAELPAIVKNAAETKYVDFTLEKEHKKLVLPENESYILEFEKKDMELKTRFSNNGIFISERIDY